MINLPTPAEFGLPDSIMVNNPLANDQMSEFFAPGQLTINFPGAPSKTQGIGTWIVVALMALGVIVVLK